MSIHTDVSTRPSRLTDTLNAILVPAKWALVLTAIALASVILVQAGVLPWTLSEVNPTLLVP